LAVKPADGRAVKEADFVAFLEARRAEYSWSD
jgi:hypothetical protein